MTSHAILRLPEAPLSICCDFCFNRMFMAQTPVELRCIDRLRLATGQREICEPAGDLR
jgi:hypothetical protein